MCQRQQALKQQTLLFPFCCSRELLLALPCVCHSESQLLYSAGLPLYNGFLYTISVFGCLFLLDLNAMKHPLILDPALFWGATHLCSMNLPKLALYKLILSSTCSPLLSFSSCFQPDSTSFSPPLLSLYHILPSCLVLGFLLCLPSVEM